LGSKRSPRFDTAGWLFWSIVFVILAVPCIYGVWRVTDEHAFFLMRIGAGVVIAAIGAGVISLAVNAVLQYRNKKRRVVARKRAKKKQ